MQKPKRVTVKDLHFQTIFRAEPEGGFTVIVPALPGCVSYGKNLIEARKMAREAISLYLKDMAADGEQIPDTDTLYISDIEVTLPIKTRQLVHA